MTTINQLTQDGEVSGADSVPIYSAANSSTRRITADQIAIYTLSKGNPIVSIAVDVPTKVMTLTFFDGTTQSVTLP